MDTRWGIGPFRFGADAVVGLVPAAGDLVSGLASAYMLWVGIQLGLPLIKLVRMAANVAIDLLLGVVPVAGDAADALFKSHVRNLRIIEEHVRDAWPAAVPGRR